MAGACQEYSFSFLPVVSRYDVKRYDFKTQPPVNRRLCPVLAGFYLINLVNAGIYPLNPVFNFSEQNDTFDVTDPLHIYHKRDSQVHHI